MSTVITAGNATTGLSLSADNAGTFEFKTGTGAGTTAMAINTSQNVGIGTTSPNQKLQVYSTGSNGGQIQITNASTGATSTDGFLIGYDTSNDVIINNQENTPTKFFTNATERMRIDTLGNLLINSTSIPSGYSKMYVYMNAGDGTVWQNSGSTGASAPISLGFLNSAGTRVGFIASNGTATAFTTSSDYRLKEDVQPMAGALAKVAQLKPCTYKWKADGSDGEGFIAHELKAVIPQCVTGEKDAVDAEGNPSYQGVDTSFLVATLTAAIQELKAELDAVKAKVGA